MEKIIIKTIASVTESIFQPTNIETTTTNNLSPVNNVNNTMPQLLVQIDDDELHVQKLENITKTLDLAKNYSLLISKLEEIANDLNSQSDGIARKQLDLITGGGNNNYNDDIIGGSKNLLLGGNRNPLEMTEKEYARFVSDIWIGVVLTMLIISIIFFICSCFLYHKFQQWKNSYRTNQVVELNNARRHDFDVESLPSYTLCSGLPSYDAALEEFRKAGIILTPTPSVVKIFDNDSTHSKDILANNIIIDNNTDPSNQSDTESAKTMLTSCSTCGGSSSTQTIPSINIIDADATMPTIAPIKNTVVGGNESVIELNPQHLQMLGEKRLSLQIAFNQSAICRHSNRMDLRRQVSLSNLLRSLDIPQIRRSTSATSLRQQDASASVGIQLSPPKNHHRGSLI